MAKRGQLTPLIRKKAIELLGVQITQHELRLMPYVQHLVMNDQNVDPRVISTDERNALSLWREREWISGGASNLEISKIFWDAMNQILWLGYVAYHDQPEVGV